MQIASTSIFFAAFLRAYGSPCIPGPETPAGRGLPRKEGYELTPLAQISRVQEFTEVSFSQDSTRLVLRPEDGSLLLRAASHLDVHLKQERVVVEMTFSAEALGLTRADFAESGGAPLQLSLSLRQSWLAGEARSTSRLVRPTRKAEEILRDLSRALADVLRQRGNKNISLVLDEEAVRSLLGDAKVAKLFSELLGLIGVLNSMKLEAGPREDYRISVSGEGNPYLESETSVSLEGEDLAVELKLTILPPQAGGPPEPESHP